MLRNWLVLSLVMLAFSGCTVADFGNTMRYNVMGEYYLDNKDFEGGLKAFEQILIKNPNNARARYFCGRFLLIDDQPQKALQHLKEAVVLSPKISKYHFWLGVAYGENNFLNQERKSYLGALKIKPDHYMALIYLGHNLLRAKEYEKSFDIYQKALTLWPYNPQALYNRAVILRKLGRKEEERLAWVIYLDAFPSGRFARLAAERLNSLEDYSYRNHRLGLRTVTLTNIGFEPFTDELWGYSKASLDVVGATVVNLKKGTLHFVVYQTNNHKLAKKRALAIKRYLYKKFPELQKKNCVRISWFDSAERRTVLKKTILVDESVQFFLTGFADESIRMMKIEADRVKKK